MRGQSFLHIGIQSHVMGYMCKVGVFGFDNVHEMQRLLQVEMGIVFFVMQGVNNQHIQVLKMCQLRIRHKTCVGNVGKRPDTKT